jgi:hypothetical protein
VGIRVRDQAKFHPMKYLAALLACVPADVGRIFERSAAPLFDGSNVSISISMKSVSASVATITTPVEPNGTTTSLGELAS